MRAPSRSESVTPEEELARLLSGTARRRAELAPAISELATQIDGPRMAGVANAQRLGPLLAERFVDAAPQADIGWTWPWRNPNATWHVRNALLHNTAVTRIANRLEGAGIASLPLKGAPLAEQLYGDAALRTYGDVDVLVARERLSEALEALRGLGYVERNVRGRPSPLHLALEHAGGVLPPLDLHWRVHWFENAFSSDLLERSELRDGVRLADPHDQLVCLLLFYHRDGFQGLRLAADIAAWWDQLEEHTRPAALADYARRYPELACALEASALVAEQVVGLPGRELLGCAASAGRRVAIATRLADWRLRRERDQAAIDASLVDGLCTPPGGRWDFARRYLFCDRRRIAEIYELPATAIRLIRILQVLHPFKITVRYALGLRTSGLRRDVLLLDVNVQLARSDS